MPSKRKRLPDWGALFEIAVAQDGLFTTRQAAQAGYSPQLLAHHLGAGRMLRVRRGVYRLVHFPAGEREELTAIWLWSERSGVFSHQSALDLFDLGGAMPSKIHITLPCAWSRRRLRVPQGVVLHHADVAENERRWIGAVPVTAPLRTLEDCARGECPPDLLKRAAQDALREGMVTRQELAPIEEALGPFGGILS